MFSYFCYSFLALGFWYNFNGGRGIILLCNLHGKKDLLCKGQAYAMSGSSKIYESSKYHGILRYNKNKSIKLHKKSIQYLEAYRTWKTSLDSRVTLSYSYSRFAITRVIVLESSYLFLTEGMYTYGYITVNVIKCLKKLTKLCILIQIKSDLLELFYLAFYIAR